MRAATMAKTDYEALAEFRYQLRRFMRFSEQVSQSHGITPLQYQMMLQLKGFPGRSWASVAELAERLQSQHHGVVALVTRCESLGLVKRRVNAQDRRRVEVHLTRAGEACLEQVARLHRHEVEALQDMIAALVFSQEAA